jgi:hypothetical protein
VIVVASRLVVVLVLALTGCGASLGRSPGAATLARRAPGEPGAPSSAAKQGEGGLEVAPPTSAPRTGRVNVPRPAPDAPVAPPPPALLPSEHFTLAEEARASFEARTITAVAPGAVVAPLRDAFGEARRISDHYAAAQVGAPRRFVVASLLGSARVWLALTSAIRGVAIGPGAGVGSDPLTDAARRALEPWAQAAEAVAIGRLVLASRFCRLGAIDHEVASDVDAILARYTDEELAAYVEILRTGDADHGIPADPSLAPYHPGEFFRARPGLTAALPTGSVRPPLEVAE